MAVVLVVDDEVGIASLLEDVLTDEGHTVLLASNGRRALDRAASKRPDVILIDYMMPVMDGAELLEAINTDPELHNIPVVVMSSFSESDLSARCSGYARHVQKPFNIFEIIALVAELSTSEKS